jgi:peptide deformylase
MAKLNIIKEPNETLRKRSKEVTEFGARLHQLLDDMRDTMISASGVGIAAVQVGILYRACLVDAQDGGIVELVNPVIVKVTGEKIGEEGCLSVPGFNGMVRRPLKVTVRAQDRNGKSFEHKFEGRSAVCVCHELDHLDGVLFVDKVVH